MANAFYGNAFYVDTVGIVSKVPISVRAIVYYPAAVTNTLDLNWWDEANPISNTKQFLEATVSGTNTFTSTGNISNIYADGAVVRIFEPINGGGNGSSANHTYHLIGTAGDNDKFVTAENSLTNETSKTYLIEAYPARPFFNCLMPTVANTFESKYHYFGGHEIPNLTCEGISGSSYAIIYID